MAAAPDDGKVRNEKLINARLRLDSPSGSGEPMSTQEVADSMNTYLWQQHNKAKGSPKPTVLDHRFVSAYESGRFWWPSRHYRAAWRAVLQVATDAELGFRPQRSRRSADRDRRLPGAGLDIDQAVGDTPSVHRRTLVALLAGFAAGRAIDRAGLAQLVAGADLFPSGSSLDDHWYSVASEYGHAYLARPRRQTARDTTIDLALLELALPRAGSDRARKAMHGAGARIAALLAMACTDLSYGPESRHAWAVARRMSDVSENLDTQLWVRGQEALLGIYSGRPLEIIEHLTVSSLESADGARGSGKADLLAAQAQVIALQGRKSEALCALDELNKTFGDLPDAVVTDVNSAYSWPEHRLRHTESFVHSVVGSARAAASSQNLALQLYPMSRAVSRCQIEMHRSVSLVRDGDVTAGLQHAASELENLTPARRGRLVLAVADQIVSTVPPKETRRPEVRAFRDYLSELEESIA